MVINYRVSRDFINYPDSDLDEFVNHIISSLTGNAAFPNPPVPPTPVTIALAAGDAAAPTDLTTLNAKFRDTIAQVADGGTQATAARDKARTAVEDALRQDANYVEAIARHDLELLLSSGFLASSTNHAQNPLDQPVSLELSNLATTKLLLRLTPVTNAKSYQVQTSLDGGKTWVEAGIFTQARRIVLANLVPGTTYSVRARAIGGVTGSSEWSQPVSQMAT